MCDARTSGVMLILCVHLSLHCAAIRGEIREIEEGRYDQENNVIKVRQLMALQDHCSL